jgi:uncharacterized protein involved in outer membrane biogenesis
MECCLMRLGKILLIAFLAVVLILAVGVVILLNLDFNEYKEQIAAEAKKATGRELKIGGDLKLNLFTFSPGLTVSDVRFANAAWGSRPNMAQIEWFEVKVDLLPLINGRLAVDRIVLSGANILIEKNKAGQGNYEFKSTAASQPKAQDPGKAGEKSPAGGSKSGNLQSIGIKEVRIERSVLTYRDAAAAKPLVLGVKTMRLTGGTDDPLKIEMTGDYNKAPFSVDGKFGSLSHLLKAVKPWPLDIVAKAGGATVTVKGTVAKPLEAAALNVTFSVAGDDLSKLEGLAGASVPPLGPYAISGVVTGRADTAIKVGNLSAKIGKSSLTGVAELRLKGRPALSATLQSDLLDLNDFLKPAEAVKVKSTPAGKGKTPAAKKGKSSDRLFPDDPLPVEGLRAADASVDLMVKKVAGQKVAIKDLNAKLRLRDGDLSLDPLSVHVAKSTINSRIRLNAKPVTPVLSVKLSGKQVDIGKLLGDLGVTDVVIGAIDADIDVNGSGKSVRALMAGLDGKTSIVMGKGRMKSDALEGLLGGVGKALTQFVVGKKSEYTVINCFINKFDVKNGVATSKTTVFDTEYASIFGKGNINLGTERIAFDVDPQPKSSKLSATAVPLEVRGTLAKPTYALNKAAAIGRVGGIVGALTGKQVPGLTGGGSGAATGNPCVQGDGGATPRAAKKAPAPSVKDLKKDAKDIGKQLEKDLKGLFGR